MRILFFIYLFAGALCYEARAQVSQPGLDASFGSKGIVTNIQTNKKFKTPSDMVIQPDGKILVTGDFIARFTKTGQLDSTFVTRKVVGYYTSVGWHDSIVGGFGLYPLTKITSPYEAFATSILLQNDGKIIVTGVKEADTINGGSIAVVIRLKMDGSVDSSFGKNGMTMLCCGNTVCLVLQPDGKILIGGDGFLSAIVTRLNPNGSIDSSFGGTGHVETRTGIYQGHIRGIGLLSDGRIAIGGTGYNPDRQFAEVVLRFLPDGRPDSSLGGKGIIYPLYADYCRDFVVLPNGKMLLTLGGINGGDDIGCLKTDGSIDSSFGINGFAGVQSDKLYTILPLADGRLLYCGAYNGDYVVGRLKKDGRTFDSSFGVNGWLATDITGYTQDFAYALAMQPDGKIVAAGDGRASNVNPPMMTLVRYKADAAVGVAGEAKKENTAVRLVPNPASHDVRITGIEAADILGLTIVTAEGKIVRGITAPGKSIFTTQDLPTGLYCVTVLTRRYPPVMLKLFIRH